jgi:hypothetical protein
MKPPRFLGAFAAVLVFAACNKLPQTTMQTTDEIEFDLLAVRLPQSLALPLAAELRDPTRAGSAYEKLVKLVEKNEATLIAWPVLSTRNQHRAVAEQMDEFRYATQYEAPGTAVVTETHPADPGVPNAPVMPVDPATSPPPIPTSAVTKKSVSNLEGVPTDFETRNLGVSFEMEPSIRQDGHTIDLSLSLRNVRLRGMKKVEIEEKSSGKKVVVEQPEIISNRIDMNMSVQDGDYALLGVFKLEDLPDQIELFVLRTRLKRVEAGLAPVPIAAYPPIQPNAVDPLDSTPPSQTHPESPADAWRGGAQ